MNRILQEDGDITEDFHRQGPRTPRKPLDFKNRSASCFTISWRLSGPHPKKQIFNGLWDYAEFFVFRAKNEYRYVLVVNFYFKSAILSHTTPQRGRTCLQNLS